MPLAACPRCGGHAFRAAVNVYLHDVSVMLYRDEFRTIDWREAESSGEEITSARCVSCGHEQAEVEAESLN